MSKHVFRWLDGDKLAHGARNQRIKWNNRKAVNQFSGKTFDDCLPTWLRASPIKIRSEETSSFGMAHANIIAWRSASAAASSTFMLRCEMVWHLNKLSQPLYTKVEASRCHPLLLLGVLIWFNIFIQFASFFLLRAATWLGCFSVSGLEEGRWRHTNDSISVVQWKQGVACWKCTRRFLCTA